MLSNQTKMARGDGTMNTTEASGNAVDLASCAITTGGVPASCPRVVIRCISRRRGTCMSIDTRKYDSPVQARAGRAWAMPVESLCGATRTFPRGPTTIA
jgi:hypothetical protein